MTEGRDVGVQDGTLVVSEVVGRGDGASVGNKEGTYVGKRDEGVALGLSDGPVGTEEGSVELGYVSRSSKEIDAEISSLVDERSKSTTTIVAVRSKTPAHASANRNARITYV